MHLTPHELDKLALHQAGFLAQKRLARGLRLNYPEAVALIATQILEFIRDGRSVAELMDLGRQLLGRADVMDRVPEMIVEVQVEGTFPDGTKLVTVHHPIVGERGNRRASALWQLPAVRTAGSASAASTQSDDSGPGSRRKRARLRSTPGASRRKCAYQSRRPAHPGRQPLSLRGDEPGARVRSRRGLRQAPRYSCRDRGAFRAGRHEDGDARRDRRRARDSRRQQPG